MPAWNSRGSEFDPQFRLNFIIEILMLLTLAYLRGGGYLVTPLTFFLIKKVIFAI